MTQPLYRNMTADQLRLQYNPSRSMPEAPQLFQGWKDRSAAFRAAAKGELDIAYPLCPTVAIPGIIRHARLALSFLWREGERLGLARNKIQISGHSAGAHLCAMLLATLWPKFEADLPEEIIDSAVLISGVYDLEPLRFIETGKALRLTPELAKQLSPFGLRSAGKARLLLCTGGQESDEFKRQTSVLGRLWARQGSNLEVITFPMRNHFTILDELALPDSALARRCLEMLEA